MTEPRQFLKSRYYPVDVERRIIYDDPAKREMDCSVRRGYRELGTIGIKGERINTRSCYQSYTIKPPASREAASTSPV
jgi:hypothetical protein